MKSKLRRALLTKAALDHLVKEDDLKFEITMIKDASPLKLKEIFRPIPSKSSPSKTETEHQINTTRC